MSEEEKDPVWDQLADWIGKPLTKGGPTLSPEDVNLPMIRHWIDAMDDRNPVYEDPAAAAEVGLDSVVAPPAMLQAWTMPRPILEGIAERGGVPTEIDPDNPINILDQAGFAATLATNSELEFDRYLKPGERLTSESVLESVSKRKQTGIGTGYFVSWVNTFRDQKGEVVGRQLFRILKFNPGGTL
jgi:acyl dehydratase